MSRYRTWSCFLLTDGLPSFVDVTEAVSDADAFAKDVDNATRYFPKLPVLPLEAAKFCTIQSLQDCIPW